MTSLENYLYHQRMARIWALSEARDVDYRTLGAIERMTDERNKYDPASREKREKGGSCKRTLWLAQG